jgi:hypothetical protein
MVGAEKSWWPLVGSNPECDSNRLPGQKERTDSHKKKIT